MTARSNRRADMSGGFHSIYGVDFSGAKLAGRNTWIARLEPAGRGAAVPYRLAELASLERLCGSAERSAALAWLVRHVAESERALWACDFPFGLPVEVMEAGAGWRAQLALLRGWGGGAHGVGPGCLPRGQGPGGAASLPP